MRKFIITSCLTGSAIIILSQFGFFEGLMAFLLAGAIPGTSYSVPSNVMYLFIMGIISLVITWFVGLAVLDFFYRLTERVLAPKKPTSHKKHLPKRRYSQI